MTAGEHCRRVVADEAGEQDLHAGLHVMRRDGSARDDVADAGRVDEDAVGLTALDDLRVTRDNRNAGLLGHLAHRVRYPAQVLDEKALLEDHADRDVARYSARHREVVDRAADGQLADIAAVEEQRLHDVRIRREGDLAAHRHGRAIVQFIEVRV